MKIKVCMGSKCTLMGSMTIYDQVEDIITRIKEDPEAEFSEEITLEASKCLGTCKDKEENVAPVVMIDDEVITNATGQEIMEKIYQRVNYLA